jgi:hypothetical protein
MFQVPFRQVAFDLGSCCWPRHAPVTLKFADVVASSPHWLESGKPLRRCRLLDERPPRNVRSLLLESARGALISTLSKKADI